MSDMLTMCKTILSSLRKKTACEMYPFKPARVYPNTRGHITIDTTKCTMCSLCSKKCPTLAIDVDRTKEVWQINHFQCIQCNECVHVCRPGALKMETNYAPVSDKISLEIHNIPVPKPAAPKAAVESTEKKA